MQLILIIVHSVLNTKSRASLTWQDLDIKNFRQLSALYFWSPGMGRFGYLLHSSSGIFLMNLLYLHPPPFTFISCQLLAWHHVGTYQAAQLLFSQLESILRTSLSELLTMSFIFYLLEFFPVHLSPFWCGFYCDDWAEHKPDCGNWLTANSHICMCPEFCTHVFAWGLVLMLLSSCIH